MFHQFIVRNRYYFNLLTFIDQQINKRSWQDWKLCRHLHGHCGKDDSSIDGNERHSDLWIDKDKVDWSLPTRWHRGWLRSSAFMFESSHLYDWLVWWRIYFCPTDINLLPAEEKWLEKEVVKKSFKRFTQTGLVLYYMASRTKKKERSGPCSNDRAHPLALQYVYEGSNKCEHIYSESGLGKHADKMIHTIES